MAPRGSRIGMGDYGGKVAPAGPMPESVQGAFITKGPAQFGEALEGVANLAVHQLGQDARELIAETKEEARLARIKSEQDQREQRRVSAVRATTDYGNDIADLHLSLVTELQTGRLKPDKLTETYDAQAAKLREKHAKEVHPEVAAAVDVQLDNTYRDTRRKLAEDLEKQRRTQMVADFGATREGLERRAQRDLPGAIAAYEVTAREVLKGAGVDDARITADVQNFKERTTFTYVSSLSDKARENPRALNQLRASLADPKNFEVLDPEKRRFITHGIDVRLETMRARAEREADKRERALDREMNIVTRTSLGGVYPTPAKLAELAVRTRGTAYEGEFRSFVEGIEDQRKFGAMPPDKMRAELERDIAAVAAGGGAKGDALRIEKRKGMYEATVRELTQDPLVYNARTTGTDIPKLDLKDPSTIPAALGARADTLLALNRTHGAALGVFRPHEALEAQQRLRAMPAEQRAGFLQTLRAGVKSAAVYQATLAQIAPDSPVTALAGSYMGRADVWQPRLFRADVEIKANDVAVRMLRGESILNPPANQKREDGKTGGFNVGKEADFNQYFNGYAGNAFPGAERVRDTYRQAVKAVYADMAVQEGDYKGEVVEARVRKAWDLVTGGGVVRFGRTDVVPPFGMTADTLTGAVYREFDRLREAGNTKLPSTFIRSAGLRQIDEGVYIVVAGGRPVPDEKSGGEPLVIDVTGKVRADAPAPTNRQPRAPR